MLKPGLSLVAEPKSGGAGCAKFRSGGQYWAKLQEKQWKLARSAQISLAGDALSDAGAALFKVGRDAEAARFCECGKFL